MLSSISGLEPLLCANGSKDEDRITRITGNAFEIIPVHR